MRIFKTWGGMRESRCFSTGEVIYIVMAVTMHFRDAFSILLNCGTWVTPDGTVLQPRFGDYLDCISGETPVFMTLGTTVWDMRIFDSNTNMSVTMDDNNFLQLQDTNGRWLAIYANKDLKPITGPTKWWPHGLPDGLEP